MLTSTESGLCSSWIVDPFCQACCLSSRHEFHMFLNKIRNRGKTIYRNSAKASESQRSNGRGKVSWRKHTGRQDSGVEIWRPTSPHHHRLCVQLGIAGVCHERVQALLFVISGPLVFQVFFSVCSAFQRLKLHIRRPLVRIRSKEGL